MEKNGDKMLRYGKLILQRNIEHEKQMFIDLLGGMPLDFSTTEIRYEFIRMWNVDFLQNIPNA